MTCRVEIDACCLKSLAMSHSKAWIGVKYYAAIKIEAPISGSYRKISGTHPFAYWIIA